MTTTITSGARSAAHADGTPALRVDDVGVRFGAFQALSGVSIEVWPGEVVGVIGPNGAGKSTLVNALAGVVTPSAGSIDLAGRTLSRMRPVRRAHLGLVRTFQTAQLFGSLSVEKNIDLARHGDRSGALEAGLAAATAQLGLDPVRQTTTDSLSGGQRKLVELVRALAATPSVLLLDEPVAGVPMDDRTSVLSLLRRHVDDHHTSVLLIEHDMEFVSSSCDWIYVMNAGEVIASGTWDEISTNRDVLEAYLGTQTPSSAPADDETSINRRKTT